MLDHTPSFPTHICTYIEVSREDDHIVYQVGHEERPHHDGVELEITGRARELLLQGQEVEVAYEGEAAVRDDRQDRPEAIGGQANAVVDRDVIDSMAGVDQDGLHHDQVRHKDDAQDAVVVCVCISEQ